MFHAESCEMTRVWDEKGMTYPQSIASAWKAIIRCHDLGMAKVCVLVTHDDE